MRPANIVTAIADVLAGAAVSGYFADQSVDIQSIYPVALLCLSTAGLYGGGVVFNDVFDAELDKTERPERPIPSGLIPLRQAALLGTGLLLTGIACAFLVTWVSGILATAIAFFALVYDRWGKHHNWLGPLNMGLCRGLNLLLGISIVNQALHQSWYLAAIPVIYIAAITMISRGEVHGGSRKILYTATGLYAVVLLAIFLFSVQNGNVVYTALFLSFFGWNVYKPLLGAIRQPAGSNIGKAVKAGVIMLIVMNAAWAAASGELLLAIVIFCLLPVSIWLGRLFAVT